MGGSLSSRPSRPYALLLLLGLCLFHLFPKIVASTAEDFVPHYKAAVSALDVGDYAASIISLRRAVAIVPYDVEINQLLGSVLMATRAPQEGRIFLETAVEQSHWRDASIVANYVETLRACGLVDEAVAAGRKGHELFPTHTATLHNLAVALEEQSVQYGEGSSSPYYQPQLQTRTTHANKLSLPGSTAATVGPPSVTSEFIALYERVTVMNPSYLPSWSRLADWLMHLSAWHLAEPHLVRAVRQFPGEWGLRYQLGTCMHKQSRFDEALEQYRLAEQMSTAAAANMVDVATGSSAVPANAPDWGGSDAIVPALGSLDVQANIGAVHQSLGQFEEALRRYTSILPYRPTDAGLMNNMATIYGGMGKPELEKEMLQRALLIDPTLFNALINLAGVLQDDGDLSESLGYINRAITFARWPQRNLLRVRASLFLSPVCADWKSMLVERRNMHERVDELIRQLEAEKTDRDASSGSESESGELRSRGGANTPSADASTIIAASSASPVVHLDSSIDRIHFYLPYHGLNDRLTQERVARLYKLAIPGIDFHNPKLLAAPTNLDRRVRVGFLSKFFGLFEPHGLLLDGAMRYLDRNNFEVFVLPVARTDGKPLHHSVANAGDVVEEIPLEHTFAMKAVLALQLDVLVFADTLSEPMSHFLAQMRLAPVQVSFWGNPITSGSTAMDYFLSADAMEHPFRSRMRQVDEPYSEQVLLLEGQGIWYHRPLSLHRDMVLSRFSQLGRLEVQPVISLGDLLAMAGLLDADASATAHLRDEGGRGVAEQTSSLEASASMVARKEALLREAADWVLFFCPQSVFKIHPAFDVVFRSILEKLPNARIVVTGGRRKSWNGIYHARLIRSLGPDLSKRLLLIPRVSSEKFIVLLQLAKVVLHPFPFDGSKTSADCLYTHVPLVTLPSEYLRGRMGLSLLKTMDMPELVARNVTEYVSIALRLATDTSFYQTSVEKIKARTPLIWEDLEFPFETSRVLCRAAYGQGFWTARGSKIPPCHTQTFDAFLERASVRGTSIDRGEEMEQCDREEEEEKELDAAKLNSNAATLGARTAKRLARYREQAQARTSNRAAFSRAWGDEKYLLEAGVAVMPSGFETVDAAAALPRIFSNWGTRSENFTEPERPQARSHTDSYAACRHIMQQLIAARKLQQAQHLALKIASGECYGEESANFEESGRNSRAAEIDGRSLVLHAPASRDPLFLLELGAIQYFRERYADAQQLCLRALPMADGSSLVHGCLGVTGMYLSASSRARGEQNATAIFDPYHLYRAWHFYILETEALDEIAKAKAKAAASRDASPPLLPLPLRSPVFSMSRRAIEINLLTALTTSGALAECLEALGLFTDLQFGLFSMRDDAWDVKTVRSYGVDIMTLAQLDWTSHPLSYTGIAPLDAAIRVEVQRVQRDHRHVLAPSAICLTDGPFSSRARLSLKRLVQAVLHEGSSNSTTTSRAESNLGVSEGSRRTEPIPTVAKAALENPSKVVLIQQYYLPSSLATARAINATLAKNLANSHISAILLLTERGHDFSAFADPSSKITQVIIGQRLTFARAFQAAAELYGDSGAICLLSNADIYFDSSVRLLLERPPARDAVYALLKWSDKSALRAAAAEEGNDSTQFDGHDISLYLRVDSQDAWAFRPQISAAVIRATNFHLGVPRCDGRLTALLRAGGYRVTNPAFHLHAIELSTDQREGDLYRMGGYVSDAAHGPVDNAATLGEVDEVLIAGNFW